MISASPPLIGGQFSTVLPPPYTLLAMTLPLRFPSNPSNLSKKPPTPTPCPHPKMINID